MSTALVLTLSSTRVQILPSAPLDTFPPGTHVFDSQLGLVAVEGTLGLPKGVLKCAYSYANRHFHEILFGAQGDPLPATKVILLAVTEHLPCINARKRALHAALDQPEFLLLAQQELDWLAKLFRSALPKHTKSPMLWRHRQWVISLTHAVDVPAELDVLLAAAQMHRSNYYSWAYARWLLRTYPCDTGTVHTQLLVFCKSHASDVSAWTFLLDFLLGLPEPKSLRQSDRELLRDTLAQVEAFAEVVPGSESVAQFVKSGRMVLSRS